MRIRIHTEGVASLTLAVLMIVLFHGPHAGADVLCVGDDGHVEIEPAFDMECTGSDVPKADVTASSPPRLQPMWSASDFDHCGVCTDVPYLAHDDLDIYNSRVQTVRTSLPTFVLRGPEGPQPWTFSQPHAFESPSCLNSSNHALKRSVALQL